MSSLYDFGDLTCSDLVKNSTIKTPKFQFTGNTVVAKCVKVYDGDSATFVFIPPGMSQPFRFSCRMLGYNSAELRTKCNLEKSKAIAARDYLSNIILNKIVTLKLGPFDKYGRILVDVYYPNKRHINTEMVNKGYGAPYDGTGPKCY